MLLLIIRSVVATKNKLLRKNPTHFFRIDERSTTIASTADMEVGTAISTGGADERATIPKVASNGTATIAGGGSSSSSTKSRFASAHSNRVVIEAARYAPSSSIAPARGTIEGGNLFAVMPAAGGAVHRRALLRTASPGGDRNLVIVITITLDSSVTTTLASAQIHRSSTPSNCASHNQPPADAARTGDSRHASPRARSSCRSAAPARQAAAQRRSPRLRARATG